MEVETFIAAAKITIKQEPKDDDCLPVVLNKTNVEELLLNSSICSNQSILNNSLNSTRPIKKELISDETSNKSKNLNQSFSKSRIDNVPQNLRNLIKDCFVRIERMGHSNCALDSSEKLLSNGLSSTSPVKVEFIPTEGNNSDISLSQDCKNNLNHSQESSNETLIRNCFVKVERLPIKDLISQIKPEDELDQSESSSENDLEIEPSSNLQKTEQRNYKLDSQGVNGNIGLTTSQKTQLSSRMPILRLVPEEKLFATPRSNAVSAVQNEQELEPLPNPLETQQVEPELEPLPSEERNCTPALQIDPEREPSVAQQRSEIEAELEPFLTFSKPGKRKDRTASEIEPELVPLMTLLTTGRNEHTLVSEINPEMGPLFILQPTRRSKRKLNLSIDEKSTLPGALRKKQKINDELVPRIKVEPEEPVQVNLEAVDEGPDEIISDMNQFMDDPLGSGNKSGCDSSCDSDSDSSIRLSSISTALNDTFICDHCNRHFRTKKLLRKHIRVHLYKKRNNGFGRILKLFIYEKCKHICKICHRDQKNDEDLRRHMLTHDKNRPFGCGDCFMKFKSEPQLLMHMKTHIFRPERNFFCALCQKLFRNKWRIDEHNKAHHHEETSHSEVNTKNNSNSSEVSTENNSEVSTESNDVIITRESVLRCHPSSTSLDTTENNNINSKSQNISSKIDKIISENNEILSKNSRLLKNNSVLKSSGIISNKLLLINKGVLNNQTSSKNNEMLSKTKKNTSKESPQVFMNRINQSKMKNKNSIAGENLPPSLKRSENLLIPCPFCPFKFISGALLSDHVEKFRSRDEKCDRLKAVLSFKKYQDLRDQDQQLKNQDQPLKKEPQMYSTYKKMTQYLPKSIKNVCVICFQPFDDRKTLIDHISAHSDKLDYRCCYCTKEHKSKDFQVVSTKIGHTAEKRLKCEHCTKHFHFKHHLNEHVQISHEDSQPKSSSNCEKTFVYTAANNKDRSSQPYQLVKKSKCNVCSKEFKNSSDWRAHVDSHIGVEYFCRVCKIPFRGKFLFNKHMVLHRDRNPPKTVQKAKSDVKTGIVILD